MNQQVILILLPGDLRERGFPALLQIKDEKTTQIDGHLPPEPYIFDCYDYWRSAYSPSLRRGNDDVEVESNPMDRSLSELANDFKKSLNDWLNSGNSNWRNIRDELVANLSKNEEIEVIIQTKNPELRQLPWHLWDVLANKKAEVAIAAPNFQPPRSKLPDGDRVRILAIQGNPETTDNQTKLDNRADINLLKQHFPDAEPLVEPTPEKLRESLWDRQGWHILFFAGHGNSEIGNNDGRIKINSQDWIAVEDFKKALETAIDNGLHLAIFNCCNGLGLANQLEDLRLPQIIVMRERVLDKAAIAFLQYFLEAFSSNKSLYASMREARSKLEGWDKQYPGTTWLPVICQNPAVKPLTWEELVGRRWVLKYPPLTGHSDFIKTVAIGPDNKILASGGPDKIVKLWNLETGEAMGELTGHSSPIFALAFSHDGKTLASASNMEFMDGTIKLWDTGTWTVKQTLGKSLIALRTSAIAFSPDDKNLATAHLGATVPFDAGINIWNLATGKAVHTLRGHAWEAWSIAFTPDGRFFISGGTDGAIKIWNWHSEKLLKNLNRPEPSDLATAFVSFFDYSYMIYSIAISPDGKAIASGDSNKSIKVWDIESGRHLRTLTGHLDYVSGLAFSPDGEILASASSDNTVKIWNPATGECLDTLEHQNRVHCVAFSSDGKTLVSGSSDQTIKVWERLGL